MVAGFVLSAANSRIDEENETEERVTVEREIERLTREISRLVGEAPAGERDELRSYALGLLREEVVREEVEESSSNDGGPASFNPLAMGIPVLLVGSFLLFLFPPVGLLLLGVAVLLVIWGILATLFSGSTARRR